jgi:hypothetical protein
MAAVSLATDGRDAVTTTARIERAVVDLLADNRGLLARSRP